MYDAKLIIADKQDIGSFTVAGADHVLTNAIDVEAFRNLHRGKPIYLSLVVTTDVVGTSSTVQFILEDSPDDVTFAAVGLSSAAVPEATLVRGYHVWDRVPLPDTLKFIRVRGDVEGANLSAGGVSSFLEVE